MPTSDASTGSTPVTPEGGFEGLHVLEPESPAAPPHRRIAIALGVIGILTVASVVTWKLAHRTEAPGFQTMQVENGSIESTVSATGTCNAVVDVQVGSQVSGNIKALYADFNTRVKAHQLVALIDPEIFEARVKQSEAAWRHSQAALENARADVRKAEADVSTARAAQAAQAAAIAKAKVSVADAYAKLVRRQTMFARNIVSKEDLDTAQAAYDAAIADQQAAEAQHDAAEHNIQSAEAALQAAGTQVSMFQDEVDLNLASLKQSAIDLAHTRITAPVDGTVVARRMDVGQTVAASFQAPTIFEIAQDLTKMQVDTNVAESDVGRLEAGQHATFTVDAYPTLVFNGRVAQIRKAPINVQNVITYDAVIEVANPDLKLFPGMTANVTILTQRRENIVKLPNAALRFRPVDSLVEGAAKSKPESGNWGTVYLSTLSSKLRPIPVRLGITDGSFTELVEGDIQQGQQVVVGIIATAPPSAPASSPPIPRRF